MKNNISIEERNKIVEENMGIVKIIVRQYYIHAYMQEDLMQEGYLGLIMAAERFDPEQGIKFESYASVWIRRYIENAIHRYGQVVSFPRKKKHLEDWTTEYGIEIALEVLDEADYEETEKGKLDLLLGNIEEQLDKLTIRQQVVIRNLYGIGTRKHTYKWLAKQLGVREDLVRQIHCRGLHKILKKIKEKQKNQ